MARRKTNAEFLVELEGRTITPLAPYKNAKDKMSWQCNECGNTFEMSANTVLSQGQGCPSCGRAKQQESRRKTQAQYEAQALERGLRVLGKYEGDGVMLAHECVAEGHRWECLPTNVLRKRYRGCPECTESRMLIGYPERLKRKGIAAVPLADYVTPHTPIPHRCGCGNEDWIAAPTHVLGGQQCPQCAPYGFKRHLPAILYVLEHKLPDGRTRTNIGVTNRTVQERYYPVDLATITQRFTFEGDGAAVNDLEKALHKRLRKHLDKAGFGFRTKVGTRECFDYPFDEAVALLESLATS
jgi:predicted  nucleic acid-binding Zn-ribbon protein